MRDFDKRTALAALSAGLLLLGYPEAALAQDIMAPLKAPVTAIYNSAQGILGLIIMFAFLIGTGIIVITKNYKFFLHLIGVTALGIAVIWILPGFLQLVNLGNPGVGLTN